MHICLYNPSKCSNTQTTGKHGHLARAVAEACARDTPRRHGVLDGARAALLLHGALEAHDDGAEHREVARGAHHLPPLDAFQLAELLLHRRRRVRH